MTDSVKLAERIVRAFEDAPTFTAARQVVQGCLEDVDFQHRTEVMDLKLRLWAEQNRNRREA